MFLQSGSSEGMVRMQGLKGNRKSNYLYFPASNPLAGVCLPVLRGMQVAFSSLGEPASCIRVAWFTGLLSDGFTWALSSEPQLPHL